jgi:hypothetical protein
MNRILLKNVNKVKTIIITFNSVQSLSQYKTVLTEKKENSNGNCLKNVKKESIITIVR